MVRGELEREGIPPDAVSDAETVVAELAGNLELHGAPPYEMRVLRLGRIPAWCEVVDSDPDLGEIPRILARLGAPGPPDLLTESGRGLLLAHALTAGHCRAYRTRTVSRDTPAKAVAFSLPTAAGPRVLCPPLLDFGRRLLRFA
ncbi:hypothetical protein D5H75_19630 [Bailinhaonella thermotolerans]|uniref:Histidine kinase/HSP90-like ATPase domain-containing protein n=1 Tax=Bailinhaonella thermotolerans TaxID=1070861 RepID=A0A3A4AZK3_9ACTN|nr:hypothetical protein D5H75_19630 [Bailinhaonella thermotolerans]